MSASKLWTPIGTFKVLHGVGRKTNRQISHWQKTFSVFERPRWLRVLKVQGFSTIKLLHQCLELLVKWTSIKANQQRTWEQVELLWLLWLNQIVWCQLAMSKKQKTKVHDKVLSKLRAKLQATSKASSSMRSNWTTISIWIIHHPLIICRSAHHRSSKVFHNSSSNRSPNF